MNKGLEVIEARWLFNAAPDAIEVVVHPQSVIHSMVRYRDGSVVAQLGTPDMRTPIAHALAWLQRIDAGVAPLDFLHPVRAHLPAPDTLNFPCLRLAFDARCTLAATPRRCSTPPMKSPSPPSWMARCRSPASRPGGRRAGAPASPAPVSKRC